MADNREKIMELCRLITTEPDPKKLGELMTELASVLDDLKLEAADGPDILK
jgi:hypothetical protein